MTTLFTSADEWAGGGYDLALEFASGGTEAAHRALAVLWSHPLIRPGYASPDVEPDEQPPLRAEELATAHQIYGRCFLGDNVAVATRSVVIAYDGGPTWLYFGFPMASLSRAYPVGAYPFDDGSGLEWRPAVDDWLRRIAEDLHSQAPFDCALIGHEPEESVGEALSDGPIPVVRWEGILVPSSDGLAWFPPTERFPHTIDKRDSAPGA